MEKVVLAFTCLLLVARCDAAMISIDADGFTEGEEISAAFAGVTLSAVGGYPGLEPVVYAWEDGLASTGTSVFANNLSFQRQWYAGQTEGFAFRVDFDFWADYVAIDIIGDDSGDYGVLNAYNASGTLIDSVLSPELGYGEVFTATISRASFDIAYIIAGGAGSTEDTVHLDNLMANVVPEPATLLLFGLGGLVLVRMRKKKI